MKNSYSIEIDAPADRVFDLIYDGDRIKEWIPTLIENETLLSTDVGVGSTFRQVYLENGKHMEMHGKVVAFEQDRYLACEIRGKAFDLKVDYSLEALGNRTRLTQNSEVAFNSVPMRVLTTLMKPFISKVSRKQLEDQFATLKALAESPK